MVPAISCRLLESCSHLLWVFVVISLWTGVWTRTPSEANPCLDKPVLACDPRDSKARMDLKL